MEVGDLVTMPGSCYRDKGDNLAMGIVLRTNPDGINRGTSHQRVKVLWLPDNAVCWEPMSWLEVINEVPPS